jgi:hypothetical protein
VIVMCLYCLSIVCLAKFCGFSPHLLDQRKKGNRVSAGDLSIIVFMCLSSLIQMLYCDLPIVLYSIYISLLVLLKPFHLLGLK